MIYSTSHPRASEWFSTDDEFRQVCSDAQSQARSEAEQEFTHKVMLKAQAHGIETYISTRQMSWLCRIADHIEPVHRPLS